jgi:hypothetical protein
MPDLRELNPDHQDFELWKEDCLTIFKELFPEEKDWHFNFSWSAFRVNRIKMVEEGDFFTQEDKDAYLKGLQTAEVTIKAALRRLELFGIKPQVKATRVGDKGLTIQIINNVSNQQSVNLSVSFEEIVQTIQESNYADEEKREATAKVQKLQEELKKESPSWEKVKGVLIWLLDFSREVFLKVLPYILDKYTKGT